MSFIHISCAYKVVFRVTSLSKTVILFKDASFVSLLFESCLEGQIGH